MSTVIEMTEGSPRLVTGPRPSVERHFRVLDAADEQAARDAVLQYVDPLYDLFGTGLVFLPYESTRVESLGGDLWDAWATYGVTRPTEAGHGDDVVPGQTEVNISGVTQHITRSLETVGRYTTSLFHPTPPDFDGLIGVKDGVAQGTDIYVPQLTLTETRYLRAADVDRAYIGTLFQLVGRVNGEAYLGFERGELLFLGAQLRARVSQGDWEIMYTFSASPNTTLNFGYPIDSVPKEGWQPYWILEATQEDAEAKALVALPSCVYVERVYDYADFTQLRGL